MKLVHLKDIPVVTTSHKGIGRKKVLVEKGLISSLMQFAQVRFAPGEVAEEHAHHDMFEVMLVENGTGAMKVNGKDVLLEAGACIVIEPQERHELTNTGNEDLVITYFGIVE